MKKTVNNMEINNKYNVGQTYYRYKNGVIETVTITKLSCYITPQGHMYRYCATYGAGSNLIDVAENELHLFETKEECRKYAISSILEQ